MQTDDSNRLAGGGSAELNQPSEVDAGALPQGVPTPMAPTPMAPTSMVAVHVAVGQPGTTAQAIHQHNLSA